MRDRYITLIQRYMTSGEVLRFDADPHGIWVQNGAVACAEQTIPAGAGVYAANQSVICTTNASVLCFSVTASPVEVSDSVMLSSGFKWPTGDAVFRLDQVSFPPGAQAYRHVHPGAGIRCLIEGQLEVQSDHHVETMNVHNSWFEDANSPVKATAGDAPTAFIRAMILPPEFDGKPTLAILDPEDQTKPRLQTNRRFFDQRITFRAD